MRSILFSVVVFCGSLGCGSDPCAANPSSCADAANGTCEGACGTGGNPANQGIWLWSGLPGTTPPACPAMSEPRLGYLDTPPTVVDCPMCTCGPSMGTCSEPSTIIANAGVCPGTGTGSPFAAPTRWDGTCTAMDPVASAGSVSVTSSAPDSQGCVPSYGDPLQTSGGKTRALACLPTRPPMGTCTGANAVCTYAKVDGFNVCIYGDSHSPCPIGWTSRRTYYDDLAECTCSCASPAGESCSSTVEAFSDDACMTSLGAVLVSSDTPETCVNVPAGSPLGSKSATPPVYTAGTCAPSLTKSVPETLCCLL